MSKLIVALLAVIGILGLLYTNERNYVLKYKEEQFLAAEALRSRVSELVAENATITYQTTQDLVDLRTEHENTLNNLLTEYSGRLRNLEKRADRYRRLSETDTDECRDLGDITTRLDRSLEEGRFLVVELRERVVLREGQIGIIGKQLAADRHLLEQVQ